MADSTLRPRKVADLTPENLRKILDDMGTGPGWYPGADLYRWYAHMCREDELEPVTHRAFSNTLRALGYRDSVRRVDRKPCRCWLITRGAVSGQVSGS